MLITILPDISEGITIFIILFAFISFLVLRLRDEKMNFDLKPNDKLITKYENIVYAGKLFISIFKYFLAYIIIMIVDFAVPIIYDEFFSGKYKSTAKTPDAKGVDVSDLLPDDYFVDSSDGFHTQDKLTPDYHVFTWENEGYIYLSLFFGAIQLVLIIMILKNLYLIGKNLNTAFIIGTENRDVKVDKLLSADDKIENFEQE